MAARLCKPDVPLAFMKDEINPAMISLAADRSIVWHLLKDGRIAIDPVPLALLNVPPFDPKMQLPVELHRNVVNSMATLGNALHFPLKVNLEASIIAAIALRSAAWITEHDCAPTLDELLPHATFSDDALKGWVMDARKRHRFVRADDLDSSKTRDPVFHPPTSLLVSATKPQQQQAIKGCVFLQDHLGNAVTLVTRLNVRRTTAPSQAEMELLKIADFIEKTNEKSVDPATWAALYFATGTTGKLQVPDDVKQRMRYIVIDRHGVMQLLSALGQTRLLRRISST